MCGDQREIETETIIHVHVQQWSTIIQMEHTSFNTHYIIILYSIIYPLMYVYYYGQSTCVSRLRNRLTVLYNIIQYC